MHASDDTVGPRQIPPMHGQGSGAATILAWMAFLIPAVGVPSELMLQDTLKSAVLATGTLCVVWALVWQRSRLRWHWLTALPLVLMAYALGSMLWSHTYLAGVEAVRWLVLSMLLWGVANLADQSAKYKLLLGLHSGITVASIWVALQFWLGWDFFPQAAVPSSTFINRNFFAEYAVAALPYSVWLLASRSTSRVLPLLAITLPLNVTALLMTGTRSALLALLFTAPMLLLLLWRYRGQLAWRNWPQRQKAAVTAVFCLSLLVMGNLPTGNMQVAQEGTGLTPLQRSYTRSVSLVNPAEYKEGSFSVRSTMWLATARMVADQPLTGVGAGAWEVQIPLYQRANATLETDYYAHNEFLQLLSEYGALTGGLVLAFLIAYLLKATATTWRLTEPAAAHGPARGIALCSLLALMIVSNAGFPWHLAGGGALLAIGLGWLAATDLQIETAAREANRNARTNVWTRTRALALLLLAAGITTSLYVSWKAAAAERHIVSAVRLAGKASRAHDRGEAFSTADRDAMLTHIRQGVAITPHYRRFTALVAEPLVASGDCTNAVWILESVVESRPHVAALWAALASCRSQLGQHEAAQLALRELQRLKPDSATTGTLAVRLWSNQNDFIRASELARTLLNSGNFDWELTEWAYALGYKTADWRLALHAIELRNARWPAQAADGHLRLGKIYSEPLKDPAKALAEFRAGLAAVPAEERANFIGQVPEVFRAQM